MRPVVLGVDGGFAKLGWCAVDLGTSTLRIVELGVVETEKSSKKLHVLASSDNIRRAQELAGALDDLFVRFDPRAICFESMSFPRNASVANKMGMGLGVLAAVIFAHRMPAVQVTPQQAKKALCGVNNASKEQIQHALSTRFGASFSDRLGALNKGDREHPADALAAIVAGEQSDVIKTVRQVTVLAPPPPRGEPTLPCLGDSIGAAP